MDNEYEAAMDNEDEAAMDNEYEITLEDTRAPLDSAHHDGVKNNACCRRTSICVRRTSICVVLSLLAVCGAIAGVVVYKNKSSQNAVASGIDDADGNQTLSCNGLASNCQRRVNEIMYATVHNAMSSTQNNFAASNNILPLEQALDAGFRGLMLDTCMCAGLGAVLCHGSCTLGFRLPLTTFEAIRDFMTNNTHEVVIIELQVGENSFYDFYDKLLEVDGLTELMYHHPDRLTPWPLISELIQNNTRLILFQHDGPSCDDGECPLGFHDTYTYMFETPYNASGFEGLMDFNATCQRSRGKYRIGASFVISNHFATSPPLDVPDLSIAEQANLAENIRNRTDTCTAMLNRTTNLLAVDFWNVGDTLAVVQEYNSLLPDVTQAPSMSPSPSASPSGGTSKVESSATQQPTALPTEQPTLLPTEQPTLLPTALANIQPITEEPAETVAPSGISWEPGMPTDLDANSTFAPGSESSFVPSAAVQVGPTASPASSIVSTRPSLNELSATNAPTLSPSYGEIENVSLNDFT